MCTRSYECSDIVNNCDGDGGQTGEGEGCDSLNGDWRQVLLIKICIILTHTKGGEYVREKNARKSNLG